MSREYDELDVKITKSQADGLEVVLAGRYEVLRRLGQGGMGQVYLAKDQTLNGREVALKTLHGLVAGNKRALKRLKKEAQNAMKLSHPHIVTTRSFEETEEGSFIIMDYIEGETLDDYLAECETLSENEVADLFGPIAEALDYAHSKGVIHRDISPSNVLLDQDKNVFLTDFGIAEEVRETVLRTTGQDTSGKVPYMSPEQLGGEKPTPAQDIYSLAATMYECLTGEPPFVRGDIAHQIRNADPKTLESESELAQRIMVGLAKDSSHRPGSAKGLVLGVNFETVVKGFEGAPRVRREPSPKKEDAGWAVKGQGGVSGVESRLPISLLEIASRTGEKEAFQRYVKEVCEGAKTEEDARLLLKTYDDLPEEYQELARGMIDCVAGDRFGPSWGVEAAKRWKAVGKLEKAQSALEGVLRRNPGDGEAGQLLEEIFALKKTLKLPEGCKGLQGGEEPYSGSGLPREVIHEKSGMHLVFIPAGRFMMGSNEDNRERPQHEVEIKNPFYMGKFPVTTEEYRRFRQDHSNQEMPDSKGSPVVYISWEDAKAFCGWAGLRLPTEAEWEVACRAGSKGRYCFGDDVKKLGDYAWYSQNSNSKTHPVGQKKPNAWGLYDMHGNVWEWCEDVWHEGYKGAPTDGSAWTSGGDQDLRVLRGGSWYDDEDYCRSSFRIWYYASYFYYYGFRCCLGLP